MTARSFHRCAAGLLALLCWHATTAAAAEPPRASSAKPEPLTVAVAANFQQTAQQLARVFEQQSGYAVRLSPGASGKLVAQIVNGAPYDVLLAADAERPQALETERRTVAGTRFTYATGRLVLWSNDARLKGRDCRQLLQSGSFTRLALANPQHAPYGVAAVQVLEQLGLWPELRERTALGENIAQAYQFVASGSATLGFVAQAQLIDATTPGACRWDVPETMHRPIEQQAVLLKRGEDHPAGRAFLQFLQSPAALRIIESHGYGVVPGRGGLRR
jgi:molybdate transport system substrate-binding protein